MTHKYICDIYKFLMATLCVLVFSFLLIACLMARNYLFSVIFAVLDIIYIYQAIKNSSLIYVDEGKIEKRFLGRLIVSLSWQDLKEVGCIKNRYVYFSEKEMTDDDRHRLCFNWPPKDMIYFRGGKKAINYIELLWNRRENLFVRYKPERFL